MAKKGICGIVGHDHMESAMVTNRILAQLSPEDFETLFANRLAAVELVQRQALYEIGEPIEFVYFLETGVASILTSMADGSSIEVGMIGNEGLIGIHALLGAGNSIQQVIVQIGGNALRMEINATRDVYERSQILRQIVNHFTASFLNMSAQTAACNRLHNIEQRCARWLLMAFDRVQSDTIPMTHEFLSSMLGVRRVGVTQIVADLRDRKLIQYRRGALTLTDRAGIEAIACECYWIDHHRLDPKNPENVR